MLPLEGIRVLDLSRLLPGPYASLVLADLGAEVIKVEDTETGDYIRMFPPQVDGQSAYYAALNRNKKSLSVDLKSAEGKKAIRDLAGSSQILLESFRPGVMDRLDLGYESLKKLNSALVYCAITGYGYDSPYRDRAGHDCNYLAIAGVLGVNGSSSVMGPELSGAQMADIAGGSLFAVISMLAALRRAEATGEGAFIDTAMTDGAMALMTMVLGGHMAHPEPTGPGLMQLNGRYLCYKVYEAADGHVVLGALEPKFWINFCTAVDHREWMGWQFHETASGGTPLETIAAEFKSRTCAEWSTLNGQFDFCCEPVLAFDELADHPHIKHRKLLFELAGATQPIPQVAVPVAFSGGTRSDHSNPPALGGDTDDVLGAAGWSSEEIKDARAKGSIR